MKFFRIISISFFSLLVAVVMLWAGGEDPNSTAHAEKYPLTTAEDHAIDRVDAERFIDQYRETMDAGSAYGGYFGSPAIQSILDQDGCVGFRYYYARNDNGIQCLVLIGVDGDGNDMRDGLLAEKGILCPPWCESVPLTWDADQEKMAE